MRSPALGCQCSAFEWVKRCKVLSICTPQTTEKRQGSGQCLSSQGISPNRLLRQTKQATCPDCLHDLSPPGAGLGQHCGTCPAWLLLASPMTDLQDTRTHLLSPSLWAWLPASAAVPWHGLWTPGYFVPSSSPPTGCHPRERVRPAQLGVSQTSLNSASVFSRAYFQLDKMKRNLNIKWGSGP